MNYLDASAWIGKWPFAFVDAHTPATLEKQLAAHGIRRSLVSHFDAAFAPSPSHSNKELLAVTRKYPRLIPVPVINPALAGWREALAEVAADPRVRAVRLLPAYHNYKLHSTEVNTFAREAIRRRLRVIVQVRLIDERHEYHAMTIKPVKVAELVSFARRHPRLKLMASGFLRSEILDAVKGRAGFLFDLSFAEWHETIRHLLEKVPVRQLAFASHTPLLITAAARAKLDSAGLTKSRHAAIASGNLERWLGWKTERVLRLVANP